MASVNTVFTPATTKTLSVTTSGTDTTTVTAGRTVRLLPSTDMYVNMSTTAASDGTNMFLSGGAAEYFTCPSGNIAAKVASGSGSLNITEMV